MENMFDGCLSLTNIDLSNFNTKNVNDMKCMFNGCSSLTTLNLFNYNINNIHEIKNILSSLDDNCKIIYKNEIEIKKYLKDIFNH
jgi:surface protein